MLATSPGLVSLGEKAWQRHPSWEESDKGEAERKRQKVRESGPFLELVERPQIGLHTHLLLGLHPLSMLLFSQSFQPQGSQGPSTHRQDPRQPQGECTGCSLLPGGAGEAGILLQFQGFSISRGRHLDSLCPTICCFHPRCDGKAHQPAPELCRQAFRPWGRPASISAAYRPPAFLIPVALTSPLP